MQAGATLSLQTNKDDRRSWTRLDKVFPVLVESNIFGFMNCVARNISPGGIFLETREPLPLGTPLRIYFSLPYGTGGIAATGEVKNHYYLNFGTDKGPCSVTGMGVRFTSFEDNGEHRLGSVLRQSLQ
jgi:hypothetical protein